VITDRRLCEKPPNGFGHVPVTVSPLDAERDVDRRRPPRAIMTRPICTLASTTTTRNTTPKSAEARIVRDGRRLGEGEIRGS